MFDKLTKVEARELADMLLDGYWSSRAARKALARIAAPMQGSDIKRAMERQIFTMSGVASECMGLASQIRRDVLL